MTQQKGPTVQRFLVYCPEGTIEWIQMGEYIAQLCMSLGYATARRCSCPTCEPRGTVELWSANATEQGILDKLTEVVPGIEVVAWGKTEEGKRSW